MSAPADAAGSGGATGSGREADEAGDPHARLGSLGAPAAPAAPARVASPVTPPLAVEIAGWYGMLAILAAYAASSFGWIEQGVLYQMLNATGAVGVALVCYYRRTWQAFLLEVVWGAIALAALASSLF